jgi:Cu(I)/Ag(I) efflux system membrane fusion protein
VAPDRIGIYSPINGFVLSRSILPEQRFDKGSELYRIADISHLWVIADIFEKDVEFVRPGSKATVRYRGREFPARVADALPQLDPQSRTLKARVELDNAGGVLRPDVFVEVELRADLPAAMRVPADAVIDTGVRKTVFVESAAGIFEPRTVETGRKSGGAVEIKKGLEPGEHIVVSGNFLIDSESRMNLAPVSAGRTAQNSAVMKDPVCGMEVEPAAKAIRVQHRGTTYYFCSDRCRKDFEASPGQYLLKTTPAGDAAGTRGPA